MGGSRSSGAKLAGALAAGAIVGGIATVAAAAALEQWYALSVGHLMKRTKTCHEVVLIQTAPPTRGPIGMSTA